MSGAPPIPPLPSGYPNQYYTHSSDRPPGIITAIGVLSIVIGCMGLAYNVITASILSLMTTAASRSKMVYHSPVAVPAPTGTSSEYVAPSGFSSAQRQVVLDGLSRSRNLSDARREQVDALLADAGTKIVPFRDDDLTADHVATNVTSTMSMPDSSSDTPADVYILGEGRLQVTDHNAVFFPTDGGAAIRSEGGNFTDANGEPVLAAVQVNAVVQEIQSRANPPLTQAQVDAISAKLQEPGQKLITASPSIAKAVGQIRSIVSYPDGSATLTTDSNQLTFWSDGTVVPVSSAGAANARFNTPNFSPGVVWLNTIDLVLDLAAALYLLIIGIILVRHSLRARRLHYIFALVKLPLVALGAASSIWWWYSFAGGQFSTPGGSAAMSCLTMAMAVAGGSLIYPVALLITLRSATVRGYYDVPTAQRMF